MRAAEDPFDDELAYAHVLAREVDVLPRALYRQVFEDALGEDDREIDARFARFTREHYESAEAMRRIAHECASFRDADGFARALNNISRFCMLITDVGAQTQASTG